jgi:hypothetical protein
MRAATLRIAVTEHTETHIDMSFAASVTELLPRLVPSALRRKLVRRSIDLPAIAAEACARGLLPGELFRLQDGPKLVRAWLE